MGQIRDTEQGEHPDRLELAVIELVRLVHFTDRLLINIAGDLGFYVPCMFVALLGSGSWEVSRLPCATPNDAVASPTAVALAAARIPPSPSTPPQRPSAIDAAARPDAGRSHRTSPAASPRSPPGGCV